MLPARWSAFGTLPVRRAACNKRSPHGRRSSRGYESAATATRAALNPREALLTCLPKPSDGSNPREIAGFADRSARLNADQRSGLATRAMVRPSRAGVALVPKVESNPHEPCGPTVFETVASAIPPLRPAPTTGNSVPSRRPPRIRAHPRWLPRPRRGCDAARRSRILAATRSADRTSRLGKQDIDDQHPHCRHVGRSRCVSCRVRSLTPFL